MNTIPAYILLLAAVIGGVYGFFYLTEVDTEKAELLAATENYAGIYDMYKTKEGIAASGNQILTQIQQLETEKQDLTGKLQAIESELRDLESTHGYLILSVPKMVDQVRKAALGKPLGDVKLNNGTVLKDAKPTQITSDDIAFLHSSGSSRVGLADLPTEIKDRFRMGKPLIQNNSSGVLGGSSSKATPSTSMKPTRSEDDAQASITSMKEKIAVLEVQITQAENNIKTWLNQAEANDKLVESAQTAGRPTYTFAEEAKKARAAAERLRDQVGKAKTLKAQLEVRLQQTESAAGS